MHLTQPLSVLLVLIEVAVTAPLAAATPKLLICSDSTTANYAVGNALQGWGYYIGEYLSISVDNLAINGRSTRSFINEGHWSALLDSAAASDFVIIEMGHNDDGDPTTDTDDRATLPGIGNDTVVVTNSTGQQETVETFGWYLRTMIADVRAKDAVPIISGMVNRNYWTGETLQADWPFADYAQQVAEQTAAQWVDHTAYSVEEWQSFGSVEAKTYYPNDNTHTNWDGARINAETFVQAVKYHCGGDSPLKAYLNSNGTAVSEPGALAC
ncbi:Uu.00g065940.m01.CDS01 [Anthostomella pinea]|uniref:Uu.00g065940.m01.CDS01 n=1 Tax=Anthostomella pinea TaxID=933095 RepID=A0AAI8YN45_9PEZI|nr:Uu.00g065940.m01.CDS01 [Anthostomella pinea]